MTYTLTEAISIFGLILAIVAIIISYRIYHNSRIISRHIVFERQQQSFLYFSNKMDHDLILEAIKSPFLELEIVPYTLDVDHKYVNLNIAIICNNEKRRLHSSFRVDKECNFLDEITQQILINKELTGQVEINIENVISEKISSLNKKEFLVFQKYQQEINEGKNFYLEKLALLMN